MAALPASKVIFIFQDALGARWSEVWYYTASGDPAAVVTPTITLAKARVLLCGYGVQLLGARISQLGAPRNYALVKANGNWQQPSALTPGVSDQAADRATGIVLCAGVDSLGRTKRSYLAGCPDTVRNISDVTGLRTDLVPQWAAAFNAFVAALGVNPNGTGGTGPWGLYGRSPAGTATWYDLVDSFGLDVSGDVQVSINGNHADEFGGAGGGVLYQVRRNRRTVSGIRGLNGTGKTRSAVFGTTQTAVTLRGTAGTDIAHMLPTSYGQIRALTYQVATLQSYKIIRSGSHKRGMTGLLPTRGRSRTRR
jgi:hypothetical protein